MVKILNQILKKVVKWLSGQVVKWLINFKLLSDYVIKWLVSTNHLTTYSLVHSNTAFLGAGTEVLRGKNFLLPVPYTICGWAWRFSFSSGEEHRQPAHPLTDIQDTRTKIRA